MLGYSTDHADIYDDSWNLVSSTGAASSGGNFLRFQRSGVNCKNISQPESSRLQLLLLVRRHYHLLHRSNRRISHLETRFLDMRGCHNSVGRGGFDIPS
jgi:hypothetical protein